MEIQVCILEDDIDICESFSTLVKLAEDMTLLGAYHTAEDFMGSLKISQPDIVITDIELPGINGIECVKQCKLLYPKIQFMMCSVFEDDERVFESLRVGATGYIVKNTSPEKLYASIRELFQGGSPMSVHIARKVVASFNLYEKSKNILHDLTEREKEVLQLLSEGLRYKEIADQLSIAHETVRKHSRNIYEKLQVGSRMDAVNKVYGSSRNIFSLFLSIMG